MLLSLRALASRTAALLGRRRSCSRLRTWRECWTLHPVSPLFCYRRFRRCHSSRPAVYMWIGTPVAHGVSPQLPPRYQACPPGGPDQEVYAPRALWQALMRGDGRLLRRGLLFVSGQGTQGHLFQRHISVVAWYLPGGGER